MMYHPTLWASTFMIFDKQDYSVAAYTPYDCFTLSQHAVIKAKNILNPLSNRLTNYMLSSLTVIALSLIIPFRSIRCLKISIFRFQDVVQ